jgi:hypothetical protein
MKDILNDGSGISFHCFQIAVWTIVLGIVFLWAVNRNISMLEFEASLLTLMGISSGTYVGFKFTEKPKTGTRPRVARHQQTPHVNSADHFLC